MVNTQHTNAGTPQRATHKPTKKQAGRHVSKAPRWRRERSVYKVETFLQASTYIDLLRSKFV
jgi:hypothetical protein